jgi:Cytochrome P450
MKQFGYGHRIMESRICVEVVEVVHQARLFGGQPFNPNDLLPMCIVNVIIGIMLGRRYPFGDPALHQIVTANHEFMTNYVMELELWPILRFLPPFRGRLKNVLIAYATYMKSIEQEVVSCSILTCLKFSTIFVRIGMH